jgi:hypothetical protein
VGSETYVANLLNQYTARTVPGVFDILGDADVTTAISVNGKAAQRQDRYWRGAVVVDNASAPVYVLRAELKLSLFAEVLS